MASKPKSKSKLKNSETLSGKQKQATDNMGGSKRWVPASDGSGKYVQVHVKPSGPQRISREDDDDLMAGGQVSGIILESDLSGLEDELSVFDENEALEPQRSKRKVVKKSKLRNPLDDESDQEKVVRVSKKTAKKTPKDTVAPTKKKKTKRREVESTSNEAAAIKKEENVVNKTSPKGRAVPKTEPKKNSPKSNSMATKGPASKKKSVVKSDSAVKKAKVKAAAEMAPKKERAPKSLKKAGKVSKENKSKSSKKEAYLAAKAKTSREADDVSGDLHIGVELDLESDVEDAPKSRTRTGSPLFESVGGIELESESESESESDSESGESGGDDDEGTGRRRNFSESTNGSTESSNSKGSELSDFYKEENRKRLEHRENLREIASNPKPREADVRCTQKAENDAKGIVVEGMVSLTSNAFGLTIKEAKALKAAKKEKAAQQQQSRQRYASMESEVSGYYQGSGDESDYSQHSNMDDAESYYSDDQEGTRVQDDYYMEESDDVRSVYSGEYDDGDDAESNVGSQDYFQNSDQGDRDISSNNSESSGQEQDADEYYYEVESEEERVYAGDESLRDRGYTEESVDRERGYTYSSIESYGEEVLIGSRGYVGPGSARVGSEKPKASSRRLVVPKELPFPPMIEAEVFVRLCEFAQEPLLDKWFSPHPTEDLFLLDPIEKHIPNYNPRNGADDATQRWALECRMMQLALHLAASQFAEQVGDPELAQAYLAPSDSTGGAEEEGEDDAYNGTGADHGHGDGGDNSEDGDGDDHSDRRHGSSENSASGRDDDDDDRNDGRRGNTQGDDEGDSTDDDDDDDEEEEGQKGARASSRGDKLRKSKKLERSLREIQEKSDREKAELEARCRMLEERLEKRERETSKMAQELDQIKAVVFESGRITPPNDDQRDAAPKISKQEFENEYEEVSDSEATGDQESDNDDGGDEVSGEDQDYEYEDDVLGAGNLIYELSVKLNSEETEKKLKSAREKVEQENLDKMKKESKLKKEKEDIVREKEARAVELTRASSKGIVGGTAAAAAESSIASASVEKPKKEKKKKKKKTDEGSSKLAPDSTTAEAVGVSKDAKEKKKKKKKKKEGVESEKIATEDPVEKKEKSKEKSKKKDKTVVAASVEDGGKQKKVKKPKVEEAGAAAAASKSSSSNKAEKDKNGSKETKKKSRDPKKKDKDKKKAKSIAGAAVAAGAVGAGAAAAAAAATEPPAPQGEQHTIPIASIVTVPYAESVAHAIHGSKLDAKVYKAEGGYHDVEWTLDIDNDGVECWDESKLYNYPDKDVRVQVADTVQEEEPKEWLQDGYDSIWLASKRGDLETVRNFVENGEPVNDVDDRDLSEEDENWLGHLFLCCSRSTAGHTPLYWACFMGQVDVVRYLLENGARDDDGECFQACGSLADTTIMEVLAEHGFKGGSEYLAEQEKAAERRAKKMESRDLSEPSPPRFDDDPVSPVSASSDGKKEKKKKKSKFKSVMKKVKKTLR